MQLSTAGGLASVTLHASPSSLPSVHMWRAAASRLRWPTPVAAYTPGAPRLFSRWPEPEVTPGEVRRLVQLVGVEALKRRLRDGPDEVVGYRELLDSCVDSGAARTHGEAQALARAMDDAGVLLLFRDKAYLYPEKVVDLVRRAVPLALEPEKKNPEKQELAAMQAAKSEIDAAAHRQVRRILWTGLGLLLSQTGLFFRLTYWELSWDVMEPVAFFATTSGLLVSYTYFLVTSRDPSYQDFMERLFLSRRRKLCAHRGFDMDRFLELQRRFRPVPSRRPPLID